MKIYNFSNEWILKDTKSLLARTKNIDTGHEEAIRIYAKWKLMGVLSMPSLDDATTRAGIPQRAPRIHRDPFSSWSE